MNDKLVYINVYEVTRHYGGPEEGGWWYDWLHCVEVFPVRESAAPLMIEQLQDEHAHRNWGNISSVLGGQAVAVYTEDAPKQSETKERPYYE